MSVLMLEIHIKSVSDAMEIGGQTANITCKVSAPHSQTPDLA